MAQQRGSAKRQILEKRSFKSVDGTKALFANATLRRGIKKARVIKENSDSNEFKGKSSKELPRQNEKNRKANMERLKSKIVDPKKTVCLFYIAGKCNKDKMCLFKHAKPRGYKKPICKLYHSWFKCRWGKDCVYVHGGEPPEGARPIKPSGSKMPVFSENASKKSRSGKKGRGGSAKVGKVGSARGRVGNVASQRRGSFGAYGKIRKPTNMRSICFNFQKGLCTRGSTCMYMHMHEGTVGRKQQKLQPTTLPIIARAQQYPANIQLQPYQQVVTQPQASTLNKNGLPAGWSSQYDPKHKINYYFNLYTGKSQWEAPTSPALPRTILGNPAAMANTMKVASETRQGTTQKPTYVQAGQNVLFGRVIAQPAVAQPNGARVQQLQYRQQIQRAQ